MTFLLRDRDEHILRFINDFGFVNLKHLMKRFSLQESNCYKVTKRLINADLINLKRIYHNKKGVYIVSERGSGFTDFPSLQKVSEFRYKHNLKVVDVYLELKEKYPKAKWISERRIVKKEYPKGFHRKKHIPDGYLILNEQKTIAIEVELTLKDENRLEKIFKFYGTQEEVTDEIWYYCSSDIINSLVRLAKNHPYIKIYNIEELLHE